MTLDDLTAEQLDRLRATVGRHVAYYVDLWHRADAAGMPITDPLQVTVSRACDALVAVTEVIDAAKKRLPQPYRPGVSPYKTSGLAALKQPWADRQAEAAKAVEERRRKDEGR